MQESFGQNRVSQQSFNVEQVRNHLQKAFVQSEVLSHQFPCKWECGDLARAAAHLIDFENSQQTDSPRPDFLLAAQTLIESVCARLGFACKRLDRIPPVLLHSVEIYLVPGRTIRRVIHLSDGLDCKEYVEARFGKTPDFEGCKVLFTAASYDEMKRWLELNQPREPILNLSSDQKWLYKKIEESGLLAAVDKAIEINKDLIGHNKPKNLLRFIANSVPNASRVKNYVPTFDLKRRINCPYTSQVSIWSGTYIAFILIDDQVKAVIHLKMLWKSDQWDEHLMVLPGTGMPWVPMRNTEKVKY